MMMLEDDGGDGGDGGGIFRDTVVEIPLEEDVPADDDDDDAEEGEEGQPARFRANRSPFAADVTSKK